MPTSPSMETFAGNIIAGVEWHFRNPHLRCDHDSIIPTGWLNKFKRPITTKAYATWKHYQQLCCQILLVTGDFDNQDRCKEVDGLRAGATRRVTRLVLILASSFASSSSESHNHPNIPRRHRFAATMFVYKRGECQDHCCIRSAFAGMFCEFV